MKNLLIMTVILFLIMIFFPLITLMGGEENDTASTAGTSEAVITAESTSSAVKKEETVSLMVSSTGKLTEMSAKEYVYGAVCAEMPASFHTEALKAQAVASYTYMKWLKENADNPSQADITDSPAIHQAFITDEELKEKWGDSYEIYSQKVKQAVESVMYEYLVYENETAMTVFHGLSCGRTVSAEEAWSSDVPYLRSVTAAGDSLSPDAVSETNLSVEEFVKPFGQAKAEEAEEIFKAIDKNEDGYVTSVTYKGVTLSAADLRSEYGLKSPFFKAEKTEKGISLTVYGKGHGVGMSQYSADYMARQGSTYKEILLHFYQGTELITK